MGNATTTSFNLTYPAATLDKSKAVLTHAQAPERRAAGRSRRPDGSTPDDTAIRLLPAGTAFKQADIYEFSYTAKDPTVNGIGFAAIRDFDRLPALRDGRRFRQRQPARGRHHARLHRGARRSPAACSTTSATSASTRPRPARRCSTATCSGSRPADGINLNLRFSQPGRTERNRQDHLYAEGVFPFANESSTDHITGKTAGRYDTCTQTNTCPFAMEIYSANEYWVKAASLFHTNPAGHGRPSRAIRRRGSTSSRACSTAPATATTQGNCQQFQNPLDSAPIQRALFVALDELGRAWHAAAGHRAYRALPTARWCRRCRSPGWASRTFRASPTTA